MENEPGSPLERLREVVRDLASIVAAGDEDTAKLSARLVVVEAALAIVMAEISVRDADPALSLGRMLSGLGGVAQALAHRSRSEEGEDDTLTLEITKTVERLTQMAEAVLPRQNR